MSVTTSVKQSWLLLLMVSMAMALALLFPVKVHAKCESVNASGGCDLTGSERCVNDQTICCNPVSDCQPSNEENEPGPFDNPRLDNAFGEFENPQPGGADAFGQPGGLVKLLNNLLRLIFTGAGIYTFLNLIFAGFQFVNALGDPKKIHAAWFRIWQSLVGLVVVVVSFIGAIILGQILFGNPGAILNLQLFGAT